MTNSTIAKRYAEALFQLAQEKQNVSEVSKDLQELVKVIETEPQFISLLATPKFSSERKKQIVTELLGNANELVLNTIFLLIDKKRVKELLEVATQFNILAANAEGTAEATVYTTRELTEAEKEEISQSFSKLVGKEKLNITNVIDPSLLGGARVQIGNYIFDNTVLNKLESLKRTLVG